MTRGEFAVLKAPPGILAFERALGGDRLLCVFALADAATRFQTPTGATILFAATGKLLFRVMGITLPAFQIAGSILLLRISLDMLYGKRSPAKETEEEVAAGAAKDDIAITPLGVPMLVGPGSISTALILLNQASGAAQVAVLFGSIALVCFASYWVFWLAVRGAHYLNPLALKLVTRIFGLLLASVAVQFIINGLEQTPFFKK